ncbi:MAG: cupin domain-containing protein [Bacteriovorax sp.]|nr:cupin domain-containing protein [Bacteriovorax sp.]
MKISVESAEAKSAALREKISDALGEQFGKETEEELRARKFSMEKSEIKNFDNADEVRNFPKGKLELVNIGGKTIGRVVFQPGWKWSTSVKPIAQTESCLAPHFQYHISGVLKVKMDSGEEYELRAGDISMINPGHDAWVVGNEPVVIVDFQGMMDYAKQKIH